MRAIAEKAGVSTTTVSMALRNHASISSETKSRILELQHLLGYDFKNRQVKASSSRPPLKRIIYRMVGVDMREENYAPFLAGISAECGFRSIRLEFENLPTSEVSKPEWNTSNAGLDRGIIISGWLKPEDIEAVERSGLPFIVLGNYFFNKPVHMVGVNLFDVAERVMQDLVSEGMTRMVFFVEEYDRSFEREFIRSLRGILFDLGIPMESTSVVEGGVNFQNMAKAKDEIVEQLKLGTHIVALEKHCAETVSHALRQVSGEGVPEPRITAFVSSKPRLPDPGYRAFDLNLELCGRLAVTRLIELQRNPELPPNSCYIYSRGWVS